MSLIPQAVQESFKELDYDNSGYITVGKLQTLLENLEVPNPEDQAPALMDILDTNHDGKISLEEFADAFEKHHFLQFGPVDTVAQSLPEHTVNQRQVIRFFEELDANSDGLLDDDEINTMLIRLGVKSEGERKKQHQALKTRYKLDESEGFSLRNMIDAVQSNLIHIPAPRSSFSGRRLSVATLPLLPDGEGKTLSSSNLRVSSRQNSDSMGRQPSDPPPRHEVFGDKSEDEDDSLTTNEEIRIQSMMGAKRKNLSLSPRSSPRLVRKTTKKERTLKQLFQLGDKDNSGKISTKELKIILEDPQLGEGTLGGNEISSKHVHLIMKQLDKSGDGLINYDEFCEAFGNLVDDEGEVADTSMTIERAEIRALVAENKEKDVLIQSLRDELLESRREWEQKVQVLMKDSQTREDMLDEDFNSASSRCKVLEQQNMALERLLKEEKAKSTQLETDLKVQERKNQGTPSRKTSGLDINYDSILTENESFRQKIVTLEEELASERKNRKHDNDAAKIIISTTYKELELVKKRLVAADEETAYVRKRLSELQSQMLEGAEEFGGISPDMLGGGRRESIIVVESGDLKGQVRALAADKARLEDENEKLKRLLDDATPKDFKMRYEDALAEIDSLRAQLRSASKKSSGVVSLNKHDLGTSWYIAKATRSEVNARLNKKTNGAFCVTDSSDPNAYILYVKFNKDVKEYTILNGKEAKSGVDGFHLEQSAWCFGTVADLILAYTEPESMSSEDLPCPLVLDADDSPPTPTSSGGQKKWFSDPKRIVDYAVLTDKVAKLNEELTIAVKEREEFRQKYFETKLELDRLTLRQGDNSLETKALKYDAMQLEMERLRSNAAELVGLRESKAQFDRLKIQLEDELRALTSSKIDLETENDELRNKVYELERATRDVANLKARLIDYERLRIEHQNLQNETEELKRFLGGLSLEDLMKKLQKYEGDEAALGSKMNSELKLLREELNREREKSRSLQIEIDSLRIQIQDSETKAYNSSSSMSSEMSNLRDEIEGLRLKTARMDALNIEITKLREYANEVITLRSLVETQKRKIAQLEASQKESMNLSAELDHTRTELSSLQAQYSSATLRIREFESMQEANDDLRSQVDSMSSTQGKLSLIQEELTRVKRQLGEAQQQASVVPSLQSENTKLKTKIRELEQLRIDLDSLQSTHQQVLLERDQHARKGDSLQADLERMTLFESEVTELRSKLLRMDAMNVEVNKLRQQATELVTLRGEFDALKRKLAASDADRKTLTSDNAQLHSDLDQLRAANETLTANLSMASSSKASLESEIEELRARLREGEVSVEGRASELRSSRDEVSRVKREAESNLANYMRTKEQLDALRAQFNQAQQDASQAQSLRTERDQLQVQYESLLAELSSYKMKAGQLDSLEDEAASLRSKAAKVDAMTSELAKLRAASVELVNVRGELDAAKRKLALAETDKRNLAGEVSELRAALERAQADADALQAANATQAANLRSVEGEMAALSDRLREAESALERKTQEARSASDEAARLKRDNESLQAQLAKLKEQLESLRRQLLEAQDQGSSLKGLMAELSEVTAQRDALTAELVFLKSKVDELSALEDEVTALRTKLAKFDAMSTEVAKLRAASVELVNVKAELDTLRRRLQAAETERSNLMGEVSSLQSSNDSLRAESEQLQATIASLKARIASLEDELSSLGSNRDASLLAKGNETRLLNEEISRLKRELDLALSKVHAPQERPSAELLQKASLASQLQIEIEDLRAQHAAVQTELVYSRNRVDELSRFEDEADSLRSKVARLEGASAEANRLRAAATELVTVKGELDSLKRKLHIVENDKRTLASENGNLQTELATLRPELEHANTTIATLQASYDQLKDQYHELQLKLAKLLGDRSLEGELNELRSTRDLQQAENSLLRNKLGDLSVLEAEIDELRKLRPKLDSANAELNKLRSGAAELITVKADNDSLKRKLAKLESERTSLQAELAQLTGSVESLNSQVSALSSQNASLAATRKHLEEELDEANAKVRQLEGSMNQRAMESRNAGTEASRLKVELDALQGKFAKLQGDNASLVQQVSGAKENAIQAAALKVENEGLHAELSMQKAQQAALKSRMAQLEPLESEMSTLRSTMTVTQTSQQRDLSGLKANNESLERKVAQLEGEKRGLDAEKRTLASQLADLQKENEDLRVKAAAKPAKKKGGKFAFESDEVGDVGGEHPRLSSWAPPDLSEGLTFESEEIVLDLGSGEPPRLSAIPEAISPKTDELETERAARKAADDARNHAEAEAQRLRDELELHNRTYHNNTVHEELAALEHSLERERGYRMLAEQRALLLEAIETPWAPTGFHPDQLPKLTQILSDEGLKSHGHGHMLSKNDLVALFAPYFEKEPAYVNVQPVPTPVLRPMPSPQTMTLVPVSPRPLAYYTSPARTLQRNQLADFFDVQVLEGPVAARLNLLGRYRCRIAPADISLLNPHTSSLVHSWPVEAIRNFGSQDGVFFFETTHGEVSFASPWADDIYFTTQKFFA